MNPFEFEKMMKKLRNGEKIICPICKKGTLDAIGEAKTTHCFECSNCKEKLNIN